MLEQRKRNIVQKDEINLLYGQIEGLQKQNAQLQGELRKTKTYKEIKEHLEIYKQIKDKSAVFTSEFTLASGAITALKWVLKEE